MNRRSWASLLWFAFALVAVLSTLTCAVDNGAPVERVARAQQLASISSTSDCATAWSYIDQATNQQQCAGDCQIIYSGTTDCSLSSTSSTYFIVDNASANVSIQGNGYLIFDGLFGSQNSRLFDVRAGSLAIVSSTLQNAMSSTFIINTNYGGAGVLVRSGARFSATSTMFQGLSGSNGGAVMNIGAQVSLESCTFSSTYAGASVDGYGGAVAAVTAGSVVRLVDSHFYSSTAAIDGGAVWFAGTSLDVQSSTFSSTTSVTRYGGAIYISQGSVAITSTQFENTSARANAGGAIYLTTGSLRVSLSTFSTTSAADRGGAIFAGGTSLSVLTSTFSSTKATDGGAIFFQGSGAVTVAGSTFYSSTASTGGGGAVFLANGTALSVVTSTFSSTKANFGGAIYATASGATTTIGGSTFYSSTASNNGGAVYQTSGTALSVLTSTFSSTQARLGGAIFVTASGATTTIVDSSFYSSTASTAGGAAYVSGGTALGIQSSTFSSTRAAVSNNGGAVYHNGGSLAITSTQFWDSSSGLKGGAIYTVPTAATINSSTFSSTRSGRGGAVYQSQGSLSLRDTQFLSSTASTAGGAVYTYQAAGFSSTDALFSRGAAPQGGAIFVEGKTGGSPASLVRTRFTGNAATTGGALYSQAGLLQVLSSTFDANSSTTGGGIYAIKGGQPATLSSVNCTFTGNIGTPAGDGNDVFAGGVDAIAIVNSTFNTSAASSLVLTSTSSYIANTLISGANACSSTAFTNASGANNLVYPAGSSNTTCLASLTVTQTSDPTLGSFAGTPPAYALQSGSPAAGNGSAAVCGAYSTLHGTQCDIGAGTGLPATCSCPDDGNSCTADYCSSNVCVHPGLTDGTGCTGGGTCQNSVCVAPPPPPPTPGLTVSRGGSGTGTVTGGPGGINCGSSCSASYASAAQVSLSAAADPGSVFTGWFGECSGTGACSVLVDHPASVTAVFTATSSPYRVIVQKTGSGGGTVASFPSGISCGATCQLDVTWGTAVTLVATPDATSDFSGWTGPCSGTAQCTVIPTSGPITVGAVFALNSPPAKTADVSVRISASAASVNVGERVTVSLGVSNAGPSTATNVTASVSASAGLAPDLTAPLPAGCVATANGATCISPSLGAAQAFSANIVFKATAIGAQSVSASVSATEADPYPANNSAAASVTVAAAPLQDAGLDSSVTDASQPPADAAPDATEPGDTGPATPPGSDSSVAPPSTTLDAAPAPTVPSTTAPVAGARSDCACRQGAMSPNPLAALGFVSALGLLVLRRRRTD